MNSTILITGGTGAMGMVLVPRLLSAGRPVHVLTLPGDRNAGTLRNLGVEVRFGDIADREACRGICDGVHTVLHLAAIILTDRPALYTAINAGGTQNLVAEAAAAGVSHFIHVSSASVVYPRPTPYSISKRLAESTVKGSPVPWTIVRPTLIYGKRGGQEFDIFLDYLRRFPMVPFIGSGSALKRPVFVEDVADGLVALMLRGTGCNKILNLSGPASISMLDFARLCLTLLGKPGKPIIHLPVFWCRVLAAIMERTMKHPPLKWSVIAGVTQDADLDPSGAMAEIGFSPRGIEKMLPGCFPRDIKYK